MYYKETILALIVFAYSSCLALGQTKIGQSHQETGKLNATGFVNSADFGFTPESSSIENTKALQQAVDQTGTIEKGSVMLDSINWGVVQNEVTYTAGVRNVIFRDIFLEKPRTTLSATKP